MQRDQIPDGRKVHMEDIAVYGHLPHIGSGVGDVGLGHAPVYLGQFVRRHHHVQVPVPFPPCRQRSSRSRLRFRAGGSFTLSSSFSSGLGSGWPEAPVVTKYPRKPGRKVLGYLCPENRVRTPWNPGLSAGPNRNAPARGLSVSSSCAPGSCGGSSSQTAFSSTGSSGRTFSRK